MLGTERVLAAAALLALFGLSPEMPAWSVATVVTALLAGLCAIETTLGNRQAVLAE